MRRPVIVYAADPAPPRGHAEAWAYHLTERHHAGLRINVRDIRVGRDSARALDTHARDADAELIVIDSNYGRGKLWASSVARRLANHAPCPVLVIPDRARRTREEHVIFEMHMQPERG